MSSSKMRADTLPERGARLSAPTVKAKLIEARALIAKGWVQGTNAVKADGEVVAYSDPRATHFCTRGAIDRATNGKYDISFRCVETLYDALDRSELCVGISGYNDAPARTQTEVLALFDKAIASL